MLQALRQRRLHRRADCSAPRSVERPLRCRAQTCTTAVASRCARSPPLAASPRRAAHPPPRSPAAVLR
eukprot:2187820-Heterocapsa_arctica.AAC.1